MNSERLDMVEIKNEIENACNNYQSDYRQRATNSSFFEEVCIKNELNPELFIGISKSRGGNYYVAKQIKSFFNLETFLKFFWRDLS